MSVEKIIAAALANNPMQMKKEFEEEMSVRVEAALEEKYRSMLEAKDEEDDEDDEDEDDEDEDEDEEDEDEEDDEDEVAFEQKKSRASKK
jgi:hypothetical protein